MSDESYVENLIKLFVIFTSEFKCYISRSGSTKGAVEEREHGDYATHNVVNAIVLNTKCLKYDS